MSGCNWNKAAQRDLMARNGVEDRADTTSKDALRRQADRLLAGYTGPVTRVAPGTHVIGSQVSGEIPRSVTGNISSEKSKSRRTQSDLFGTGSKSKSRTLAFDKSVPSGLVIYCDGACEPIIGNERADELSLEGRESILALSDQAPTDLIREQLDYSARSWI